MKPKLLVCDDDQLFWSTLRIALKDDYRLEFAGTSDALLEILDRDSDFALLLLDVRLKNENDGFILLPQLRRQHPRLPVLITSGLNSFEAVLQAMRLGASDYLPKDYGINELKRQIHQALARKQLPENVGSSPAVKSSRQHVLLGASKPMQELRRIIERVRDTSLNVVLFGEPGSGKEVVARLLGANGDSKPFIAVDSSTIPLSTAESILFGHERGSFTGADRMRKGVFEEADGGTVYFDEIANMPYDIQAKLLRVLQEKEVTRLGATKPIHINFRVICATNRDIETLSHSGEFRFDLFTRLSMVSIQVPSLRSRTEDIPELVRYFTQRFAEKRVPLEFTERALLQMKSYSWPGNVRELANLVACLSATTDDLRIDIDDLPEKLKATPLRTNDDPPSADQPSFYDQIRGFERSLLDGEYEKHSGNVSRMAKSLRMDRSHLFEKLKNLGIHARRETP